MSMGDSSSAVATRDTEMSEAATDDHDLQLGENLCLLAKFHFLTCVLFSFVFSLSSLTIRSDVVHYPLCLYLCSILLMLLVIFLQYCCFP